ncbi:hypothetical protein P3L10_011467 [Capsicum annuum]
MEQPRNVNSILELTIQSQDGSKLFFRMKPNITMRTIFKYYCKEKQIIDYRTVRFVFDGQRISARMTVKKSNSGQFRWQCSNRVFSIPRVELGPIKVASLPKEFSPYPGSNPRPLAKGGAVSSTAPQPMLVDAGLKDGDQIDAVLDQDGGGCAL